MKGIIFNLTELAVTNELGEDMWDLLLEDAGVDGVYSAIGDYPTSELAALASAAANRLDLPIDDTLRWIGFHVMTPLAERYPDFFSAFADSISFLETLDGVIHQEVRKLYEGARPPRVEVEALGPDRALVTYRSIRCLDALAEGMLEGTAAHFGQQLTLERHEVPDQELPTVAFQCHFTHLPAESTSCRSTPTMG